MGRQRHTAEQIISKLREAEVLQAKRLKELEQENGRLRKVVSDLSTDNTILKEASRKNW